MKSFKSIKINKIVSLSLLVVAAIFFSQCVSTSMISLDPIHRISDFPTIGLNYQLSGNKEVTNKSIIDFLTEKGIRYTNQNEESSTYIVTTYLKEPSKSDDRRLRRTSYLIKLKDISPKDLCTDVAISWLVESRGIRESTWQTNESDQAYTPSSLAEIRTLFNSKKCK